MEKEEFLEIINKYLAGSATESEEQLLINYYNSFQHKKEWDNAEMGKMKLVEDKLLQRLKAAINHNNALPSAKMVSWRKYVSTSIAAAILILFGVVFLWNNHSSGKKLAVKSDIQSTQKQGDLAPGGEKAMLTLGDGTAIVLDSAQNGALANQGSVRIVKLASGQLIYKPITGVTGLTSFNTITTPKGGQYQVTLPDGTKVWLNAASSLRFPTVFSGSERRVDITGEVYFEVAKNKEMPFKVKAHDCEITVLGTHFNVNAYDDESGIRTTLLEGSVKISRGNQTGQLKPGQQAVFDLLKGSLQINNDVNLEDIVAWKDGKFQFSNADIPSIMREIARWYDVRVVYEGNVPTDRFTGKVTRNTNASNVLKILSLSDEHFRIDGDKIIVTSK